MTEKKLKIPRVFLSLERWNSAENGTWKNKLYNIFYMLFWIFAALGFFLCRITWAGIWIFFSVIRYPIFIHILSFLNNVTPYLSFWLIYSNSIYLIGWVSRFFLLWYFFFGNYNQSIEPSTCLDMFLSLFWSVAHKKLFRCMFGTCF